MANASTPITATGSENKLFTIPFSYINSSHLKFYVDGVDTSSGSSLYTATVQTGGTQVEIKLTSDNSTPAAGKVIKIERNTPITTASVVFSNSSTLKASDLNTNTDQLLFAVQEAADDSANSIVTDSTTNYDAQSRRIKNVADPVDNQDASTKAYTDAQVASTTTNASAAATSATNAATSATNAATSATNASTSETNAAASAVTSANESSAVAPKYTFSNVTDALDPGVGILRIASADASTATNVIIDDQTADTGNPNVEDWLKSFDDSTSTIKGTIRIVQAGTPANYAVYNVTGLTDSSGFIQLAVSHVDSNFSSGTTFADAASLRLTFSRSGDLGTTGATGPQGNVGTAATIAVGSTTTGSPGTSASVANSGSSSAATFDFTSPRGDVGATGPTGPTGAAATIAVGTVTTGAAGSSATVTNSGSSGAATFDFAIPRGDTGAAGSLSGAADGSASAPSISFSADTNTGIFRSGTDTLDVTTGGTTRATFSTTGVNLVGTPTFGGGALAIANGGTGSTTASAARTALGLGTAATSASTDFEAADSDILKADTADVLTAGFASTVHDLSTISSGTTTLDEANGNLQKCVNGGAFTLAPPSNSCTIVLQVTNNASAGAVTTSGFTKTDGDAISTGDGDDFFFYVTVVGSFSHLTVKKLS